MPKKIALAIGVAAVDARCYQQWPGTLRGPRNDVSAIVDIARSRSFDQIRTLTTEQATCAAVLSAVGDAARELAAGDLFLLAFSGHGRQFDDRDFGPAREDDKLDETWCLFDGQLLDDEIRHALSAFAAGVRVVVVSDSCHSGTVTETPAVAALRARGTPSAVVDTEAPLGETKRMPADVAHAVDVAERGALHVRLRGVAEANREVRARVLLLAACGDPQLARDGDPRGVFTQALVDVWDGGAFAGTYAELRDAIAARVPGTQTPRLFATGPEPSMETERVFSV